jgi:hypothetical protein
MGIVTALGCTGGFQCPTGAATLTSVTYLEPIVVTRGVATEFTGTAEIGTYNFIAQDPAVSNALGQRVLKIDGQKFTATIPTLVGGIIHDVSIRRLGSSNGPTTRIMLTSMTGGRGIEVASPLRTGQATTVYFGLTDKRSGASRVEVVNLPAGLTYSLTGDFTKGNERTHGPGIFESLLSFGGTAAPGTYPIKIEWKRGTSTLAEREFNLQVQEQTNRVTFTLQQAGASIASPWTFAPEAITFPTVAGKAFNMQVRTGNRTLTIQSVDPLEVKTYNLPYSLVSLKYSDNGKNYGVGYGAMQVSRVGAGTVDLTIQSTSMLAEDGTPQGYFTIAGRIVK